jgi:hypothetical protein
MGKTKRKKNLNKIERIRKRKKIISFTGLMLLHKGDRPKHAVVLLCVSIGLRLLVGRSIHIALML